MPKLPKLFIYLLGLLFIINIIQSSFTELIYDEAYYWYYSQNMAWGYFDHPPMMALMIKISSLFFDGELGVRFMTCVLSAGTPILLWLLIDNPKKKDYVIHFFVLIFSMTLLNAYGFFTLPDTPLLFFTTLFLYLYKKFISTPTFILSIGLGFVMAALMYSKYHAVLVIVFVLLSNLKLVFNKYAWLAVFTALLCYTPHFYWLYENDFASIAYHIFERPNSAYNFNQFTLGFFLNLLALFGFTFFWIYKALIKNDTKNLFQKALVYLSYGVILFFFISSFNRRIQTQWIIIISIPLVVIAFNYMLVNENARKWIYRMGIVNIFILIFLRFALVFEQISPIHYESHGAKKWVVEMAKKVGKTPVIFENSYTKPSLYTFYSGNTSFGMNNVRYRRNQYSLDDSESKVQHKKVVLIIPEKPNSDYTFEFPKNKIGSGTIINDFESFRKLRVILNEKEISKKRKDSIAFKVYNPYSEDIDLKKIKYNIAFHDSYRHPKSVVPIKVTLNDKKLTVLKAKDTTYYTFKLPEINIEDPGYFKVSISENGFYPGLNGDNIKLVE
ncbi:glycosyltransferase family 39 protein [Cellulophaga sp. HaHaR_3_176]|uniref:ArnT family glycosyltransferase n=1 Tax=Cellulophaga sp. HaHaR_3_176 TaxID=1942464 RepID=UPI001C1FD307|nr:glycosyltransferase family 39 protein [Cellulophaga sp. HaHaR_3_176]QWX83241.1 glycosyltransferase family 39 protein [Cellulophaga sp. HaHaR_3_176]